MTFGKKGHEGEDQVACYMSDGDLVYFTTASFSKAVYAATQAWSFL